MSEQTTPNISLLPCPFCGGPAKLESFHGSHLKPEPDWCVSCNECDYSVGTATTPEASARFWNTRKDTTHG